MALNKNKKFYKKFLSAIRHSQGHPKDSKQLLRAAPLPVLKLISNAAIVASKGSVKLTPSQKRAFRDRKKLFGVLASRGIGFEKKRRYITQRGRGAFIPILLSAVLPLVGELLFRAIKR